MFAALGCFVPVHVHLRDAGGQEPARRDRADPDPRHPAIGADSRLPVVHGDVLPRPVSRQRARRRMRGDLRHLHQPGLEHGVLVLSVAAHGAARPRRGRARLPPHRLAEVLAARSALRRSRPDLEHDDVDVGRLVLRRRVGGDHRRRHHHHPARRRLLHRRGQQRGALGRDPRRGRDDGRSSSCFTINCCSGRSSPGRRKFRVELSVGQQVERSWVLEPAPAHQLDPSRRAADVRWAALGGDVAAAAAAASFPPGRVRPQAGVARRRRVWIVVIAAVAALGAVVASSPTSRPSLPGPTSAKWRC